MDIAPPHPRERYKHYKDPELRRKSFRKWPESMKLVIRVLIDEGFFSIDDEARRVQCVYCGGVFAGVKESDNVHIRHYRHFPKCERFKWRDDDFASLFNHQNSAENVNGLCNGTADSDVEVDAAMGGLSLNQSGSDDSYLDGRGRDSSHPFYMKGETKYPRHTYYALYIDRLRTFKGFPEDLSQKPEELAKAGLFYTEYLGENAGSDHVTTAQFNFLNSILVYKGVGDACECYCCGGQLEEWEPEDVPLEEHEKWFSDMCPLSTVRKKEKAHRK